MKTRIRVLACLFGFILISILVLAQQQKSQLIEYVLSAGTEYPLNGYLYTYVPTNQGDLESFLSSPLLTVHVPPSPLSNAVFVEFSGHYRWYWGSGGNRYIKVGLNLTVQSPVIPSGISVIQGGAGTEIGDVNVAGPSGLANGFSRISKYRMARNTFLSSWAGGFDVVYTANNEPVPQEQAVRIINRLMNTGFDLEFSMRGKVAGVEEIQNLLITVEITRLATQK